MNYINVKETEKKVIIQLAHQPDNAINLGMVSEIYDVVRKHNDKVIVILGYQIDGFGKKIFSKGINAEDIENGSITKIAMVISQIVAYLNRSNNYVIAILQGDSYGCGWGLLLEIADKVYYRVGTKIRDNYPKTKVLPFCGIGSLISLFGSQKVYDFITSGTQINLSNSDTKKNNWLVEYQTQNEMKLIIKNSSKKEKRNRKNISSMRLKSNDVASQLINSVLENPTKAYDTQLKFLRKTLENRNSNTNTKEPKHNTSDNIEVKTQERNKYREINVEIKDHKAILRLSPSNKKSNVTASFLKELRDVLSVIQKNNSVRFVILRGNSQQFCGGLSFGLSDTERLGIQNLLDEILVKIEGSTAIFIAEIDGSVAREGLSIAIACDIRITAPKTDFYYNHLSYGYNPTKKELHNIIELCGIENAKLILYMGAVLPAETAWEYSLVTETLTNNKFSDVENRYTRSIGKNDDIALRLLKKSFAQENTNTSEYISPFRQNKLHITTD